MKTITALILALSLAGCGVSAVKIKRAEERALLELAAAPNRDQAMFWEGYLAALKAIQDK